jgi:spore maturation protein CgeB
MRLVVFGLSVTSSWGNGHATLWRALCRGLARRGHRTTFFERDVPWYAENRDATGQPGLEVVLYPDWTAVEAAARRALREADAAIVTSYCPDGPAASRLAQEAPGPAARVFYDLDTPVTLDRLAAGERPDYLPPEGLGGFDLVLSYTGGTALERLRGMLGARRTAPLYGSVDPDLHRPVPPPGERPRADLSYIGTYAADRQAALERLLIEPARRLPDRRFVVAGAQYPRDFPWTPNIFFQRHQPPGDHPGFFAASRLTLNVTRRAMAESGWCPSGRLFEAAACGTPVLSDRWEGLDAFYAPGEEILIAQDTGEAIAAVSLEDAALARIGARARARTLEEHGCDRRAAELVALLEGVAQPARQEA